MITLFLQSMVNLVMAECACASLTFTSFNDLPSLVCVDPKYLNWFTSSTNCPFTHMLVGDLDYAIDDDFAFSQRHFHSVSHSCFLQSFGEAVGVLLDWLTKD